MSLEDLTVDQLLARARQLESSAGMLDKLARDPKTRPGLQRLIKQANPDLVIPEIDAVDQVNEKIKASEDKIQSLETKILERDIKDRLERQRAQAKSKYKLSDEDIVEVEKLMTHEDPEERIPGYDAASRVFTAQRQQSIPTSSNVSPPVFTMPDKDVWAKGFGNKAALDRIATEEAYAAWNDIRSGKVAV